MNSPRPPFRDAKIDALEARFALRVCARLSEEAHAALPHDITERLRIARLRAVEQAERPQTAVALAHAPSELASSAGSLGGGEGSPQAWLKLASVLPLLVLLAGLALIHYFDEMERIDAAAEVDAALLADDLPPQAYTDPGFAEFMSDSQSRE